jgi:hypothetical protein
MKVISVFLITSFTILFACKHEIPFVNTIPVDTTTVGGTQPCSIDTVYFKQQILPIITSNCASSGCHDAGTRANNVQLTDYASIVNTGRIVSGNSASSKFYRLIATTNPGDIMPPPPRSPLSAAQIALVKKWIDQGAKNNTCSYVCDTTNVKYSTTVEPILAGNCRGCHSAGNASGGVSYADYNATKITVLNNKLVGSISHSNGFIAMPKNLAKLSQCDIDKVKIWIRLGALNN